MEESSIVAEGIRKKLNDEGVYREAPDGVSVFKTVDRLTQAINAGHITPAEIHGITKTLQKIQRSNPGNSTGRAAEIARQELFDYLKKFPELEEAINVGNANYRVFKTSDSISTRRYIRPPRRKRSCAPSSRATLRPTSVRNSTS
jgi:hypothetical protein